MPGEAPTDTIEIDAPDVASIGVTRGTNELTAGRPRDYPDQVDVTVEPDGDERLSLSIDAVAGDHATGHADVELTLEEARALRDLLDETVRWMAESRDPDS